MIGFLRLQRSSMRFALSGVQIGMLLKHRGHLLQKFRSAHWRKAARKVVAELVAMLDVSRKEIELQEMVQKTLVLRDGKYVEEKKTILVQPRGTTGEGQFQMYIDNEVKRRSDANRHFGAIGVQRIFRGLMGQRRAKMYRPRRAAIALQATWRAFVEKRRVRLLREYLAMKTAATRIQSQWRVSLCFFYRE